MVEFSIPDFCFFYLVDFPDALLLYCPPPPLRCGRKRRGNGKRKGFVMQQNFCVASLRWPNPEEQEGGNRVEQKFLCRFLFFSFYALWPHITSGPLNLLPPLPSIAQRKNTEKTLYVPRLFFAECYKYLLRRFTSRKHCPKLEKHFTLSALFLFSRTCTNMGGHERGVIPRHASPPPAHGMGRDESVCTAP